MKSSKRLFSLLIIGMVALSVAVPSGTHGNPAPANVRLTNDVAGGYQSAYTIATGIPYTDNVLNECSISRGRQNEPAVAVDPRDPNVIIGSSNDYGGVYQNGVPSGPIWAGYYRSENGGASFQSSLVPGYPGDTSPYAALAQIRTASAGDPVIAWDNHGRAFVGAETSDDPAGTKKTFGDEWVATFDNPGGESGNTLNDGKRFLGNVIVAQGSSAPNLLGKFLDKTAIQADRTGGIYDGFVYFSYSRFSGNHGDVAIYFSRSTDHGATWSPPAKLTSSLHSVQNPEISVTANGHVYVTLVGDGPAVYYARSTDGGNSFEPTRRVATLIPSGAIDVTVAGAPARDCGSLNNACQSGYTFFRRDSSPRSSADQFDTAHEYIYIVYEATKPGTEVSTGTTYGSIASGLGGQSAAYFVRLNGATGQATSPALLDNQPVGHQFFPAVSADHGVMYAIWWDSRRDPVYSPARPIGNDAAGHVVPSLDVWAAKSTNGGATWTRTRLTAFTTNGNYEQFSNRTVPFAGDYLWVSSVGSFAFAAWTDWRDTVAGADPREPAATDGADVMQCRTFDPNSGWSGDTCPHAGGLDQNIYGASVP